MESLGKQFGEIVAQRLKALGTNAFALETAAGLPPDALRNVVRSEKRAGPTLSRAQEICEALDLELYIGPRRDTGPVEQIVLNGADYASISLHDAWLSAGPGAESHGSNIVDQLAFRRDWLKREGIDAARACLARVIGDSMLPTLTAGDMVLINQAQTEPAMRRRGVKDKRRPPIYALVENGEARIKRIERPDEDTMILLSDNPEYPPEIRTPAQREKLQTTIIGKVMWWCHTAAS